MKTCDTCGESIAPGSAVCPFCEAPQLPDPSARAEGPAVRDLDIEAGLPTVAEALRRLAAQIDRARDDGVRVVRVIHVWGSKTGGGGRTHLRPRVATSRPGGGGAPPRGGGAGARRPPGGGARPRPPPRQWLQGQREQHRIRLMLLGDHYTHTSPEGRDFIRRHPALRSSERTDRENPGITFVEP